MNNFWTDVQNEQFGNEASVELRLVIPLLHALGYEDCDISPKHPVVFQEGRSGRKPEADFVVFYGPLHNKDTSLLVVEAKTPGESFVDAKTQGESYSFNIRAPFLLLTDGNELEIWQLQPTLESECIVRVAINSIQSAQGKIEACLSKESALAYCKTFSHKNIVVATEDFGVFELAELKRTAKSQQTINRTLSQYSGNQSKNYLSLQLLSCFQSGAIIVAPSGFGKTTLSTALLRQAIEDRWKTQNGPLPLDVPLPDLSETELSILEFIRQRIAAHHPGFSEAILRELLREKGAILLCDAFDRLSSSEHRKIEVGLKNLIRDFPLLQIFVFSRASSKPALPLPSLVLEHLSYDQQREFVESVAQRNNERTFPLIVMPELLLKLCTHPLLMGLALDYWQIEERFPSKIEELFRSWLDVVLLANSQDGVGSIDREAALTLLAKATTETPISKGKALSLLREHGFKDTVFTELLRCDAFQVNGSAIELQHEALADYLRALDLASLDENKIFQVLSVISLEADSLFPVLLMALLPSRSLQQCLWKRLAHLSLPAYLNSLRYRANVTEKMKKVSNDELGFQYLQDLIEGIEYPLNGFFPQLKDAIIEHFIGPFNAEIAISGVVYSEPEQVVFGFRPKGAISDDKILIADPPKDFGVHYVNLKLSEYRLDSGRLLGAKYLKESLLKIVEDQTLKGGAVWTSERLIGRLRYLAREYSFPIGNIEALDEVAKLLKPHEDKIVGPVYFGNSPVFTIKALLDDIAFLQANGQMALDPWWFRLGWKDAPATVGDEVIQTLLDEHFRRLQLAYVEVVENSFKVVADSLGFYSALPVRWDLAVVRRKREPVLGASIYTRWFPVLSWKAAGADCEFSDTPPARFMSYDFSEVEIALEEFGRFKGRGFTWGGFEPMPSFDGYHLLGGFDGETTVMRSVCDLVISDINRLFSELPGRD